MQHALSALLAPFGDTAFTAFGAPTTWGEVAGFVTGAWCVWLTVRNSVWNWPVGNLNSALFLLLFLDAGLFADSALQVVYIALGFYGWWAWLRGGARRGELPITRTTGREWVALGLVGVVATMIVARLLAAETSSTVPWADAVTTVISLLATWSQARRKLESWWLWMAVDAIYVPLYQHKQLTLTAILYAGFLALCVAGLRAWTREFRDLDARGRGAESEKEGVAA